MQSKKKESKVKEEVLNEVPPVLDESLSENSELLLEVPPLPSGSLISDESEIAPEPSPRKPRNKGNVVKSENEDYLNSLSAKQKKMLMTGFSKKTLAGRFGIRL